MFFIYLSTIYLWIFVINKIKKVKEVTTQKRKKIDFNSILNFFIYKFFYL